MTYAYARISSRDQNLDRQLSAFRSFGIPPKHIFCDKKSGKDFERKNYLRLIRKLKCGDLLVIKSIDRLGRSYDLIIEEWSRITNKILADILLLDMPLLDTRAKPCSLVGKFISDIVLQVLSFVAENERENTRARQAEGIAEAKRKDVRFGRPPFRYSQSFLETAENYYRKTISLEDALLRTDLTRSAFYYHYYKLCNSGILKIIIFIFVVHSFVLHTLFVMENCGPKHAEPQFSACTVYRSSICKSVLSDSRAGFTLQE